MGVATQADGAGPGHPARAAAGLDRRLLRRARRRAPGRVGAGQARRHRVLVAGLDRARTALPAGPAGRDGRADRAGRGHAALGPAGRRAPAAVPAHPGRARLGRAGGQPGAAHGPLAVRRPVRHRGGAGGHAGAAAGRRAGPHEPGRRRGQRPVPGARPVLRRPVLPGRRARLRVVRADRRLVRRAAADPAAQPGHGARRRGNPERRALHQLRPGLRPRRGVPGPLRGGRRRSRGMGEVPGRVPGR